MALLDNYKKQINNDLADFFAGVLDSFELDISKYSQEALKLLQQYTMRPGKRIRGSLAAASYDQAVGALYSPAGVRLGVALELVQSYLLIIDDVMDKSLVRRGEPTVQQMYKRQNPGKDIEHEANMLAVNVGLIAQHFSSMALAGISVAPKHIVTTLQIMQKNIVMTGFGQVDDMHQQFVGGATTEDILRTYNYKCSYYTFINPLQCGLSLAGSATKKNQASIVAFGQPAGIAFQLSDDLMAIFGDDDQPGKASIDDIREGKHTLLVQYALQHATDNQVAELTALLGTKDLTDDYLPVVRDIFEQTGAKKHVQQQAQKYADAALAEILRSNIWSSAFAEILQDVMGYVSRSKV